MQDESEQRQERAFHGPDARTPEGAQVMPAVKARQGLSTGRVLTVLAVGLALVMIGFAASYVGAV